MKQHDELKEQTKEKDQELQKVTKDYSTTKLKLDELQKELDAALSFKDKFETASAKLTQSTFDLEAANKKLNTLISEKKKLNKNLKTYKTTR